MAISAYCSLSPFPPPPSTSSSSPISKIAEVSCAPIPRERSWKNQCVLGFTCAVIGIGIGDFAAAAAVDQERAISMDVQAGSAVRATRWSDRRACQPWRINSLETIVPENLPRPSAPRRWEATGFSETAPPVKVAVKSGGKSCFLL